MAVSESVSGWARVGIELADQLKHFLEELSNVEVTKFSIKIDILCNFCSCYRTLTTHVELGIVYKGSGGCSLRDMVKVGWNLEGLGF